MWLYDTSFQRFLTPEITKRLFNIQFQLWVAVKTYDFTNNKKSCQGRGFGLFQTHILRRDLFQASEVILLLEFLIPVIFLHSATPQGDISYRSHKCVVLMTTPINQRPERITVQESGEIQVFICIQDFHKIFAELTSLHCLALNFWRTKQYEAFELGISVLSC